MEPTAVAAAYFDAIRARDANALRRLFTVDAELFTSSGTFVGADAIADFYAQLAFAIEPQPTLGPWIVDGGRVAVEIDLTTTIGRMLVADVFTIEGDLISRLVIYGTPDLQSDPTTG